MGQQNQSLLIDFNRNNIPNAELNIDDLPNIDQKDNAENLAPLIYNKYITYPKEVNHRLLRTCFYIFRYTIIKIFILYFIYTLFFSGYCFGMFILIVRLNEQKLNNITGFSEEMLYFLCIIFCKIMIATLKNHCHLISNSLLNKVFTSIAGILMDKAIKQAKNGTTQISNGEFQNLVQTDALNIGYFFTYLYVISSFFFIFIEVMIFLSILLGYFSFITIGIILIYALLNCFVTSQVSKASKKKLDAQDNRMKYTTNTFTNIKEIIINAWPRHFISKIENFRKKETKFILIVMFFKIIIKILFKSVTLFNPIVTFVFYYFSGYRISVGFNCFFISIMISINLCLEGFPEFIYYFFQAVVSSQRIEKAFDIRNNINSSIQIINDPTLDYSVSIGIKYYGENLLLEKNQSISQKKLNSNLGEIKMKIYNLLTENSSSEEINDNKIQAISLKTDLKIKIKKGEVVFILGKLGSGKSALFHAFNSEINFVNNFDEPYIKINGKLAYCDQTAWIQSCSIEDNICFSSSLDQEKMKKIINICQLDHDIEQLPFGIKTEAGDKGGNLSGGQKVRISLARAIYSEADIFLIDNPFPSLDREVRDKIMIDCFRTYLKGKTLLISSSSTDYIHPTDKVIFFKDFQVHFVGSFKEYMEFNKDNRFNLEPENKDITVQNNTRNQINYLNVNNIKSNYNKILIEKPTFVEKNPYLKYLNMLGGWKFFLLVIFLVLCWNIFYVSSHFMLINWALYSNSSEDCIYMKLSIIFVSLSIIFSFPGLLIFIIRSYKLSTNLHTKMIASLLSAPLHMYYDRKNTEKIINVLIRDLSFTDVNLPIYCILLICQCIEIFTIIIVTVLCMAWSIILFIIWILILNFYYKNYSIRCRYLNDLQTRISSNIFHLINENSNGKTTIQLYSIGEHFLKKFCLKVDDYCKCSVYLDGTYCFYIYKFNLINILFVALILFGSIIQTEYYPTSALFNVAIMLLMLLDFYTDPVSKSLFNVETYIDSFERCFYFAHITQENDHKIDIKDLEWELNRRIIFENYSTKYKPNLQYVLKNFNLRIEEGEKVGIIGRTGSGKSTIFLSLIKVLEAYEGSIYFGNQNIQKLSKKMIREQITVIDQDHNLFIGNLRENVDPLNNYTNEEIYECLRLTGLDQRLKQKTDKDLLELQIEEHGRNLSVGESQLICICRGLIKKSKIILLDEATSSFDNESETIITSMIYELFRNCTIIAISHRPHTLKTFNKIVVLEDGKIKEIMYPPFESIDFE